MKRVILVLASAFIIAANAYAVEPYAFGIKVGGLNNNLTNFTKEISSTYENKFFNLAGVASLYGEYAFHENVGAEVEAGYLMGQVDSYKAKQNSDKDYRDLSVNMVKASLGVKLYPMGRADKEEMGILTTRIGADFYLPISAKWGGKKGGSDLTDADKEIKKDELNSFGIGAGLVVGYEFPFGLLAELNGGMVFTDFFKEDAVVKKDILKISDKNTKNNLWNFGLSLGYNFATLLEE
jgi:hypothetical protein